MSHRQNTLTKKIVLSFLSLVLVFNFVMYPKQKAEAFAWAGFLPAAFTVPVAGQALLAATVIGAGAYIGIKYGDTIINKIKTDWSGIQAWYNNRTQTEKDNMASLAGTNVPATSTFSLNSSAKNLINLYLNGNTTYFIPKSVASIPASRIPSVANINSCISANGGGNAGFSACIAQFAPLSFVNTTSGIVFRLFPMEDTGVSPPRLRLFWYWWNGGTGAWTDNLVQSVSEGYTMNPYSSTNGFKAANITIGNTVPVGEPTVQVLGTTDTGTETLQFLINNTDGTTIYDWYIPFMLRVEAMLKMYGVNPVRESWFDVVIPGGLGKPLELEDEIKVPPGVVTGTSTSMTIQATEAQAIELGQAITADTAIEVPSTGKPGDPGTGNRTPWAPLAIILAFIDLMRAILGYMIRALVFLGTLPFIPAKELGNEGLTYLLNFRIQGTDTNKYFTNVIPMDIALIDLIRSMLTLGIAFAIYKAIAGAVQNGLDSFTLFKRHDRD